MPYGRYSSFLAGYRTSPLHRFSEDEIFGHNMLKKSLNIISWFQHSSDPKFTHLATRCQHYIFSKEHVISRSHPDNLVCRWDPLYPQNSDPDCPGHPTHFQPCYPSYFINDQPLQLLRLLLLLVSMLLGLKLKHCLLLNTCSLA